MIHYIIYTKNRAAQLDLLLQSIDRFALPIRVDVIARATTQDFADAYALLTQRYTYRCLMSIYEQSHFKNNALLLLQRTSTPLIGFLTDDTIFYRQLSYSSDELYQTMLDHDCNSFSLRNGYNTQDQCHYEQVYLKLKPSWENDDLVMWDTSQYSYSTDFGRPISIDGNFFTRDAFMPMLISEPWNDPRSLDGINPGGLGKNMMAFKQSVVVNVPVNLACDGYADNWGRFIRQSLEDLNTEFLSGKRLDLDSIDFSNIWSSHQELELKFK